MKVHQIQVGNMQNFTYILEDEDTDTAIVLDPSWDLEEIQKVIEKNNLKVKYIVNTHHHFDHTIGNEYLTKITNAKIIQHNASSLKNDLTVSDGDKIEFGNSDDKFRTNFLGSDKFKMESYMKNIYKIDIKFKVKK